MTGHRVDVDPGHPVDGRCGLLAAQGVQPSLGRGVRAVPGVQMGRDDEESLPARDLGELGVGGPAALVLVAAHDRQVERAGRVPAAAGGGFRAVGEQPQLRLESYRIRAPWVPCVGAGLDVPGGADEPVRVTPARCRAGQQAGGLARRTAQRDGLPVGPARAEFLQHDHGRPADLDLGGHVWSPRSASCGRRSVAPGGPDVERRRPDQRPRRPWPDPAAAPRAPWRTARLRVLEPSLFTANNRM